MRYILVLSGMGSNQSSAKNNKPISSFIHSIDDSTIQFLMKYIRFEDYDSMVNYVNKLGIKITYSIKVNQDL